MRKKRKTGTIVTVYLPAGSEELLSLLQSTATDESLSSLIRRKLREVMEDEKGGAKHFHLRSRQREEAPKMDQEKG